MTKDLLAQLLNCDPADILTTAETAALLGNTARAVTAAAKRGALTGHQIGEGRGSLWYFIRADVEAYASGKQTWKATASHRCGPGRPAAEAEAERSEG